MTLQVSKSVLFAAALYLKNSGSLCLQWDTSVLRVFYSVFKKDHLEVNTGYFIFRKLCEYL